MTELLLPKMIEIPRGYFRLGTDSPPSQMYVDEAPAVETFIVTENMPTAKAVSMKVSTTGN